MPSMPPKDTSMLDWNRNTIKIRKNQTLFFVSTNSKPDPYLGLEDHTDWEIVLVHYMPLSLSDRRFFDNMYSECWMLWIPDDLPEESSVEGT